MPLPTTLSHLDVIRYAATLTNTGDGLSQAMRIDPAELEPGAVVYVLTEATITGFKTKPIDKDDPAGPVELAYVMKAGVMTLIEEKDAKAAIDVQREKNRLNRETQAGVASLPVTPFPDDLPRGDDGFYDPAMAENPTPLPTRRRRTKREDSSDA